MSNQSTKAKPRKETLQEIKKKIQSSSKGILSDTLHNVYEKAEEAHAITRKKTGICFDDKMVLHKCEWDYKYPENPYRYTSIIDRCNELDLFSKCERLSYEKISKAKILKKHTPEMYDKLENMYKLSLEDMEQEAAKYDSTYFNKHSFECALIAAGCVQSVVENVCKNKVQNGMAIVRPPGHHAMTNDYCGYCFFNNVGIAAQYALDNNWAQKILIIDYDVHHGQATQQMYYDDNRVLYFSIHRYENGTFWPNLRESNFDYIGSGDGKGYNVNAPLNATGLNDIDYLSIVFHILLPIAYEFNPDLIIFSAGYDSCIGCPEGEMNVTPGFYGHLMTLLSGLADGKLVVCLEGGYFPPSLAEGVAMTIKGLLDEAPALLDTSHEVHACVVDVINNLKTVLRPFWKCFQSLQFYTGGVDAHVEHTVVLKYLGTPLVTPFETRNCYLFKDDEAIVRDTNIISALRESYAKIKNGGVCYAYDDVMLEHYPECDHPENPLRLTRLYKMFCELKLNERCKIVKSKAADGSTIKLVHTEKYVDSLLNKSYKPKRTDIYFNSNSLNSILMSTGCLLRVVDLVMKGPYKCGAALIRPPGHHAEPDEAQGFCFISNVAVAAKYIIKNNLAKRVLIIDFDIHHGNGTQYATYDSKDILYISMHKYNNANFFPYSTDANFDKVGCGEGTGYNINIPFNDKRMTDTDYIAVFHRIVLPVSYSFAPDIVIVSAGFDAGIKDTIGNYTVSPQAFGHFIQLLKPLAMGRIILALEGGYNINTLAYSMNMCIKVLLGDPLPKLVMKKVNSTTVTTIENVINCQKPHWPILKIEKRLLQFQVDSLISGFENLTIGN